MLVCIMYICVFVLPSDYVHLFLSCILLYYVLYIHILLLLLLLFFRQFKLAGINRLSIGMQVTIL